MWPEHSISDLKGVKIRASDTFVLENAQNFDPDPMKPLPEPKTVKKTENNNNIQITIRKKLHKTL